MEQLCRSSGDTRRVERELSNEHARSKYLLQILHLSCQVQRLPGYQAPWGVLLRNRMAERFASVSEDELFSINVYKAFPLRIFLF